MCAGAAGLPSEYRINWVTCETGSWPVVGTRERYLSFGVVIIDGVSAVEIGNCAVWRGSREHRVVKINRELQRRPGQCPETHLFIRALHPSGKEKQVRCFAENRLAKGAPSAQTLLRKQGDDIKAEQSKMGKGYTTRRAKTDKHSVYTAYTTRQAKTSKFVVLVNIVLHNMFTAPQHCLRNTGTTSK